MQPNFGSEVHDEILLKSKKIVRPRNNSGGRARRRRDKWPAALDPRRNETHFNIDETITEHRPFKDETDGGEEGALRLLCRTCCRSRR